METIVVKGGNPLKGTIEPVANKNAILPALAASLLTTQTVTYKNVPESPDVKIALQMLKELGATIDDKNFNNLKITCKGIKNIKINEELSTKFRSSIFFAGPLLARMGEVIIPTPGGCVLGMRSISAHLDAFKKLGVKVIAKNNQIKLIAPETLSIKNIWLLEASVSASENIALFLAGVSANVTITDFASEPHTKQLLVMLKNMGATIKGEGSNLVTIKGVKNLKGCLFTPYPDHIDISSLIVAGAITKGKLTIKNANIPQVVNGIIDWYKKFNVNVYTKNKDIIVDQKQNLKLVDIDTNFPLSKPKVAKFAPRPWPGYPVDALPALVVLATLSKGQIILQNWMYETGFDYVQTLKKQGANIKILDNQKILIKGPCKYKGGVFEAPVIIQGAKAIFLASLTTSQQSTIKNIDAIKRRYPDYINTFNKLGANITKV